MFNTFAKEFWIPLAALVLFFVFQAQGALSEAFLTLFAFGASALLFFWNRRIGEAYLYFLGIIIGLGIEIGFRYLGYQQVWEEASFFGIPYWLPIAWGIGFVLITRVGVYIRGLSVSD